MEGSLDSALSIYGELFERLEKEVEGAAKRIAEAALSSKGLTDAQ